MKKEVRVTLVMAELLYDVKNETYLRGRVLLDDSNYKEVASMYATLDEENRDKIVRSLKKAYHEVRGEASEYLADDGTEADDGLIDVGSDLVLRLVMPGNFDESVTGSLAEAVHEYLVKRVVGDWYVLTNKKEAEEYVLLARLAMERVGELLGRRRRPCRPERGFEGVKPFGLAQDKS